MKKLTLALLLLAGLSVLAIAQNERFWLDMAEGVVSTLEGLPSSAGGENESGSVTLTIINSTDYPVKNIFICKAGESDWGKNFLSNNLQKGQSTSITIEIPAGRQLYNVRMIDIDGDKYTSYNLDVRNRSRVRITNDHLEF